MLFGIYCDHSAENDAITLFSQEGASLSPLSLGLALTSATRAGFIRLCVEIYNRIGLSREAVELALDDGDLECAISIAKDLSQSTLNESQKADAKRLWMSIAKHQGVDKVDLAARSDGVIRVEDVLPLLITSNVNDRVDDRLKTALASSLQDHRDAVRRARRRADRLSSASESIRSRTFEVKHKRERQASIATEAELTRFPCGHAFRTAPKSVEACPVCGDAMINQVADIFRPSIDGIEDETFNVTKL